MLETSEAIVERKSSHIETNWASWPADERVGGCRPLVLIVNFVPTFHLTLSSLNPSTVYHGVTCDVQSRVTENITRSDWAQLCQCDSELCLVNTVMAAGLHRRGPPTIREIPIKLGQTLFHCDRCFTVALWHLDTALTALHCTALAL